MARFLDSMLDYGVPELWPSTTDGGGLTCLEQDALEKPISNCEFGANWILLNNLQKPKAEEWLQPYRQLDWTYAGMHDGAEAGSQTQILVVPQAGVYVVVLTNTDGNDEWAAQMMAMELMEEIK